MTDRRVVLADADTGGVMVCLVPPEDAAKALLEAAAGDVTVEEHHITLAYLGGTDEVDREILLSTVARWADTGGWRGLTGKPNGWGVFNNADEHVLVALWDIPFIAEFRADLTTMLQGAGIATKQDHGFTPHSTMGYYDKPVLDLPEFPSVGQVTFTGVTVSYGKDWSVYPLSSGNRGAGEWRKAADLAFRPTRGMFAPGSLTLDPRVFDAATERMLPEVRATVLGKLDAFWAPRYGDWRMWAAPFLAGSGASYWWDSDRDFDTLVQVDVAALRLVRPQNIDVSEPDIDAHLDMELKTLLDPLTSAVVFAPGEAPFAVTYFVNPGRSLLDLKPYAAYDLVADTWLVHPPVLPPDWGPQHLPGEIWRRCEAVAREAAGVLAVPDPVARSLASIALFDWLHRGRQLAYSPQGRGWLDFGNIVWQYLSQHPDRFLARLYLQKHPELAAQARRTSTKPEPGSPEWYDEQSIAEFERQRHHRDDSFQGVTLEHNDEGYTVHTHRARWPERYPAPEDIPDHAIEFIRSTGQVVTATGP